MGPRVTMCRSRVRRGAAARGLPGGVPSGPWLDGTADPLPGAGSSPPWCAAATGPGPLPCRRRWSRCAPTRGRAARRAGRVQAEAGAVGRGRRGRRGGGRAEHRRSRRGRDRRRAGSTLQLPLVQLASVTRPTSPAVPTWRPRWPRRTAALDTGRGGARARAEPRPPRRPTGWRGACSREPAPSGRLLDPRPTVDRRRRRPASRAPPRRRSRGRPPTAVLRQRSPQPCRASASRVAASRGAGYLSMSPTTKNIEPRIATMSATRQPGSSSRQHLHVVERRGAQLQPPRRLLARARPGSSR